MLRAALWLDPQAAVTFRVGWSVVGVQDPYLRNEKAGDQHVGPTVSCLTSSLFSSPRILPPHFIKSFDLSEAVRICFEDLPANMVAVCSFLLASVVYHYDHLISNLPTHHRLF